MNDINDIDFKMMQIVEGILLQFKYIWDTNPIIEEQYEYLSVTNKLLAKLNAQMVETPEGITKEKDILRPVIIEEAFIIKQALFLYYKSKGMNEEAALVSYGKSHLKIIPEAEFILEVINIYEKALPLATLLLPYSVALVQISKLVVDITLFSKYVKQWQLATKKYTSLVKLIDSKIKEFKVIFKEQLDVAVDVYADSAKDFVRTYKNARKRRKKPGRRKTYTVEISGKVTDNGTKRPLKDVTVMAGAKKKTVVTGANGMYKIKVYKTGLENITFTHSDRFNDKTVVLPKTFVKNVLVLNVEMTEPRYYERDRFSE